MNSAIFQSAQASLLFRPLDLQFAQLVAGGGDPCRFIAAACLSSSAGQGHVCLSLARLLPDELWSGQQRIVAEQLWQQYQLPTQATEWIERLLAWPALAEPAQSGPIHLYQQQLYLQRAWQDEQQVAQFFNRASVELPVNHTDIRRVLDRLFGHDEVNDQKVAAAVALTAKHAIISGGPGTGKTTTVAKLLAALIELSPQALRIQMAAPTGKAAARLTESLGRALQALNVTPQIRAAFPTEATTLHRLLGAQANTRQLRYHARNPLHLDILVVDEASMVDLSMMASLIAALPPQARVIFLGDRDQLASVEAGAVLGDICRTAEFGYSVQRAALLTELTGCPQIGNDQAAAPQLRDNICLLKHSYRFGEDSGIGQLARAVNLGQAAQVNRVLAQGFSDIAFNTVNTRDTWRQMLVEVCAGYQPYLQSIHCDSPQSVLANFNGYQLLCALRDGPFGVQGLNHSIESALRQQALISAPVNGSHWYAGRPIMITRNDSALGLFNGDIGITLWDGEQQQLKVYFQLPDGSLRAVQPSRLPAHETAWVMTVHKSQGSEFTHTALILPQQFSPVLSRELVYTAITRARSQLTIYAESAIFNRAISNPTARYSGLTAALG